MDVHNREYNQAHATVYEQKEAVGHSVRAVYMYTAMAELASLYKDEKLYQACCDLWENMTQKRMYITGGIGRTCLYPYNFPLTPGSVSSGFT